MERLPLYIHANKIQSFPIALSKGKTLDFCTYFNSFSLKKWQEYTTIKSVTLQLRLQGQFRITFTLHAKEGDRTLYEETTPHYRDAAEYEHTFQTVDLSGDILSFSLQALSAQAFVMEGAYYGEFARWQDRRIGIGICTFKREKFVKKTTATLAAFQQENPWLQVLVVDNGRTLEPVPKGSLQVMPNPNYGGSGGFTRAIMEYEDRDDVDYVLLMDDDIDLEPSALERTHSLLCGLRNEYKDSFLAGSMLILDKPTIQHEKTAYWGKIRLYSNHTGADLAATKALIENEASYQHANTYGAWWYCCMPLKRMRQIGLPLPVFVKGDDMEYGMRNHRPWLSLNGIGVWHQGFTAKISDVVYYYSDRNMLIINNYADGCGWLTFTVSVCGRIVKRFLQGHFGALHMLDLALQDYRGGFQTFTSIGADKKMKEIMTYAKQPGSILLPFSLLYHALLAILTYPSSHKAYIKFRQEKLKDNKFWKQYLGL